MISSISLFEIISAVVPNSKIFFWIAAYFADAAVVNPNGTKTLLANGVSTYFINGKPTDINSLRKLRNPPFWLLMILVLVVSFNKIPVFSKDLITFAISFTSLFVSVVPEPVIPKT